VEENAKKPHSLIARNFGIHPHSTNFDIFSVQNSEPFPILIANKIFHVTVLLLVVYFYDQFAALIIHHSRRHCSVCQQST